MKLIISLLLLLIPYSSHADSGLSAWENSGYLYIKNPIAKNSKGGPLILRVKIPPNRLQTKQLRHMKRCKNTPYIEKQFGRYRFRYSLIENSSLAGNKPPLSSEVVFEKLKKAVEMIAKTDFQQEIDAIPNPILQYCPHQSDDPSYFDWKLWERSNKQTYLLNISDTPLRKGELRLTTLLIHEFSHAYDYLRGLETPEKKHGIARIIAREECVAYMKQLHALNQLGGYDSEIRRVTGAIAVQKEYKKELARNLKSYKHCDIFRETMERQHPDLALFRSFDEGGRLDTEKILPYLMEWNRSFIPD